jgi:hypothetical protein
MASLIKKRKPKLARRKRSSKTLGQALRDLRSTSNSPKVTKVQQKKSSPGVADSYVEEFERKSSQIPFYMNSFLRGCPIDAKVFATHAGRKQVVEADLKIARTFKNILMGSAKSQADGKWLLIDIDI